MISLTELRAMLKENKIRGYLHYNKSELVDVLIKEGLLPETMKITTITSLFEMNPKYNFLKHIRNMTEKLIIEFEQQKKDYEMQFKWRPHSGDICLKPLIYYVESKDTLAYLWEIYAVFEF